MKRPKCYSTMKKAFTFIEIMIVVAILGIAAAIILPVIKNHITEAKETSAKDTLRIMRNIIEVYTGKNGGVPPGYLRNDTSKSPGFTVFWAQLIRDGKYINNLPENPFNKLKSINVVSDTITPVATGEGGWIYNPTTRDFKIDWPGKDSKGVPFADY